MFVMLVNVFTNCDCFCLATESIKQKMLPAWGSILKRDDYCYSLINFLVITSSPETNVTKYKPLDNLDTSILLLPMLTF